MQRNGAARPNASRRVDMVILKDGEAIVVVEAKGIPIPDEFRSAVLAQIQHYAQRTNSRWALLVDPETVRIFARDLVEQPVATIPSDQILRWAGVDRTDVIGESTLLLAIEWWLTDALRLSELPRHFPDLAAFAHDLSQSDQVLMDATV